MGRYFSIKSVFKIIFIIIAVILTTFIMYSFSDALSIAKIDFADKSYKSSDNYQKSLDDKAINNGENQAAYINKSSSAVVMEASTLRVLGGQNKDVRLEMASTTKVMTALVVIENADLDKAVKIPDEAVGIEGSSIYLKKNEIWTIRDLLYGLMLRSGNDAATALAIVTGGSIDGFVNMMNKRAEQLGLANTHFQNPHGLHGDQHYTSAYDLAVISSIAMQNKTFKEIVGCKMYTVEANETHPTYYLANKNKMLGLYDGANGVKTGYTKDSGRCLVSAAERNGMQLVCVVLNIYDTYNTCSVYLDKAFQQYAPVTVGKQGDTMSEISVDGVDYGIALQNDLVLPLKEGEIMGLTCNFEIDADLSAPLKKASVIGKILFYHDNRLLFSANIVNIEEIVDTGVLRKLSAYTGEMRISIENGEIKQIFSGYGDSVETRG